MKRFNTAGKCTPSQHYMVNIERQVEAAAKLVRQGDYFCINRGRQYGKTTTLALLTSRLSDEFLVFSISFEGLDDAVFARVGVVCAEFLRILKRWSRKNGANEALREFLNELVTDETTEIAPTAFTDAIDQLCSLSSKPLVLIIDEVDQASNNDGFLKFLGVLRNMFLSRDAFSTFHSVILAGVYDVKNLKLRIRNDEEHQYNSPWNIAVPFDVDMSLSAEGIADMLTEYRKEHNLELNAPAIGQMIRDYTGGYPFLVSRICQIIDTKSLSWDKEGVLRAVNAVIIERNTLFDNMIKKLDDYPELKAMLKSILLTGKTRTFNLDEKYIQIASLHDYIVNKDGKVAVACRIMETRLYNLFISEEEGSAFYNQGQIEKNQFVSNGVIDMKRLLERFAVHMGQTYKMDSNNEFVENDARKLFLTFLRPVINGVGNYYIEAQTRDHDRMDVVIDYLGRQYVVELKIWRGNTYNERGEEQLCRYLDYFGLQEGYLLSFCFNKKKTPGLLPPITLKGRTLIEAVV